MADEHLPQPQGKTQDLFGFTAQVRTADREAIVGTAFAVDRDRGWLITCRHVVRVALGQDPPECGAALWVSFPQLPEGPDKHRRARLECLGDPHDVVLLRLEEPPLPPQVEVAVLGAAADSMGHPEDHPFQSQGYRRLTDYQGLPARGTIVGFAEHPGSGIVVLQFQHLDSGMSGAAVLDRRRNLVVGVVAQTWDSGGDPHDRDTNFAVDCAVLGQPPFNLSLRQDPLPLYVGPPPPVDLEQTRAAALERPGSYLEQAPNPLPEWVGRVDLLRQLNADWQSPERLVTGLIGFGGEGKSSLSRRWLDNLPAHPDLPQPDGVFWWGFCERRSVEEFLAAALTFLSGGQLDPRRYPSAMAQAHLISGMLYGGRYLFVLDGLEVLQHEAGDRFGLLQSQDLRDFLDYFARPGHQSFCLITSRTPLLDLERSTTYTSWEVERLSPADGRALLQKLGVKGPNEALDRVVKDWDGHALTLSLLAGFLVEEHGGDIAFIEEIPPPTADEPRYDRVQRVLRRYDGLLSQEEEIFLEVASAFRLPVPKAALGTVFREPQAEAHITAPLARLEEAAFATLIEHLVDLRLLRHSLEARHYTLHPLVRAHYLDKLGNRDEAQVRRLHACLKDFYLSLAGPDKKFPTLADLAPFIEAVHHACRAGEFDPGLDILYNRIYQRQRNVLNWQLGAHNTALTLYQDFFPKGDLSQEPQVSHPADRAVIIGDVGFYLSSLGRLAAAPPYFERNIHLRLAQKAWANASRGCQNLAEVHTHLGDLTAAREAATQALALARRADDQEQEVNSLSCQDWVAHLQGDLAAAAAAFTQAEALERQIDPTKRNLYGLRGIQHADHRRRAGDPGSAREIIAANREICERNRWTYSFSGCRRLLGDLAGDAGEDRGAQEHYHAALELARAITSRDVLIEALRARGRWLARRGEVEAARRDLEEALDYATSGGYRIYEADSRVGLAWAHLKGGDPDAARTEAARALQMSTQMGYHWGQVDAQEVLDTLKS